MAQPNQITVEKTFWFSRRITYFCFGFFIPAGIMAFIAQNFDLSWLRFIYPSMFRISMMLIAFSWIMPGILLLLRVPWFARAWLKGITPRVTIKPWKEYSRAEVFSTYFHSILFSVSMVLGIISFILAKFPK